MGNPARAAHPRHVPRSLHILATGGTIDKVYFDALSEFQVGEPSVPAILRDAGLGYPFELTSLMRKDSLDMTEADRAAVRDAVEASDAEAVIVTHGTDTMVDTARALGDVRGRTVVFVGAMQPAALRATDAVFNSGFALAAAQLLPEGVWIAMNGEVFRPDEVRKDREGKRFVRDELAIGSAEFSRKRK